MVDKGIIIGEHKNSSQFRSSNLSNYDKVETGYSPLIYNCSAIIFINCLA